MSFQCWNYLATAVWQLPDIPPRFPDCHGKIVPGLEVQPEFQTRSKPVAQAHGRAAGDRTLAHNNLREAVRRHGQLPGKRCGRYPDCCQLALEHGAGMDRSHEHAPFPV